jgi:hypothetical protein
VKKKREKVYGEKKTFKKKRKKISVKRSNQREWKNVFSGG